MKISTKGRYALRLMIDIAIHDKNGNVSLRDVSQRQNISVKYLEQIVSALVRVGLLKSIRGAQGGYKLTRKVTDYTVGDILRVTEGPLAPVSCLEDEVNSCERAKDCATLKVWSGLYKVINEYVDSITLQDLVDNTIVENGAADFCI